MVEVVAALIVKDGRFMICQRPANKKRAFLWEFVGGKVEKGESKEQALVRECREELGVAVRPGALFCEVDHDYPDISVRLSVYYADIVEGVPQKLEHNDIKWITTCEIPLYEFCPADKDILEKIKKEL